MFRSIKRFSAIPLKKRRKRISVTHLNFPTPGIPFLSCYHIICFTIRDDLCTATAADALWRQHIKLCRPKYRIWQELPKSTVPSTFGLQIRYRKLLHKVCSFIYFLLVYFKHYQQLNRYSVTEHSQQDTTGRDVAGWSRGFTGGVQPGTYLKKIRKTTKTHCYDSQFLGPVLKVGAACSS